MKRMTTELYLAAASGNVAALDKHVDFLVQVSYGGNTALHISAFYGYGDFVEKLFHLVKLQSDEEADLGRSFLRAQNEEGNTALHEAVKGGDHAQIIKLLIEIDTKFEGSNRKCESTLSMGAQAVPTTMKRTTQSDEEQRPILLSAQNEEGDNAVEGDHAQIVPEIFTHYATFRLADILNNKGESPLFIASTYGRLNALKELLKITHPLSYTRSDGQTCLHQALFYQKDEIAKTLIEKDSGLCKQADNVLGNTPLHVAALRGCRKSIVEKLLHCDTSSPFKQDNIKKQTPLHVGAEYGRVDIVKCILAFAEDCVEIRSVDGKTALHYAVENAHVAVVLHLVRFARVINTADNNNHTALDIANQNYNEKSLSAFFGIRLILQRKKAIEGKEAADQRGKPLKLFPTEEGYSTTINSLSVCAILIATVTFQAAFTLPRKTQGNEFGKNELPGLVKHSGKKGVFPFIFDIQYFRNFVIMDTLAFCLSVAAALLLAYANFLPRNRNWAVITSAIVLPLALAMMMCSFSAAIHVQIGDNHSALAYFPTFAEPLVMGFIFIILGFLTAFVELGVRFIY